MHCARTARTFAAGTGCFKGAPSVQLRGGLVHVRPRFHFRRGEKLRAPNWTGDLFLCFALIQTALDLTTSLRGDLKGGGCLIKVS